MCPLLAHDGVRNHGIQAAAAADNNGIWLTDRSSTKIHDVPLASPPKTKRGIETNEDTAMKPTTVSREVFKKWPKSI